MRAFTEPTSRHSVRVIGVRVVIISALIAMISQFFRYAQVVVAPDIMRDTGVTAQVLGYLSGALFITAAVVQIPIGILLDRHGPRRTVPAMLLMVVFGSLLFAMAQDAVSLIVARICMGLGLAALAMAAIVASTRWFTPEYFGTIVGIILGLSYAGSIAATAPMAVVSAAIGWRQSFAAVAVLTAALAIAAAVFIRDAPPGHPFHGRDIEAFGAAWRGVAKVLAIRDLWPLLVLASTAYAVVACMLGLWAGPYLYDVYGLDATARGNVTIWFPVGMMLGNFTITPLDRILDTRKRLIVFCGLGMTAVLLSMAVKPHMSLFALTIAFGIMGILSAYSSLIITHGRSFYPDRLMGRGVTVVNTAVLGGAGILQAVTGLMAGVLAPGAAGLSADIYRTIFASLAVVLLSALFLYRRCPDVPPSQGRMRTTVDAQSDEQTRS